MYEFYVTIVGARQGAFHGEATMAGQEGKIVGLSYDQAATVPHQVGFTTGRGAAAKVAYEPVRFTKQWGAASPQLFEAMSTGETLTSVVFEFIATNEAGEQSVFHRVSLFEARVVELRPFIDLDVEPSSLMPMPPLEQVGLAFGAIRIENIPHGTVSQVGFKPRTQKLAPKPRTAARSRTAR
jgi:type VI secretion system secreted protein Hcp